MTNWAEEMHHVMDMAAISTCNVIDVEFDSGHTIEVYVAVNDSQRTAGLSRIQDLDMGMLFAYERPTYVPFTMADTLVDLDIAHYDEKGVLIDKNTYKARSLDHIVASRAFTYVIEMPAGTLPSGNFKVKI